MYTFYLTRDKYTKLFNRRKETAKMLTKEMFHCFGVSDGLRWENTKRFFFFVLCTQTHTHNIYISHLKMGVFFVFLKNKRASGTAGGYRWAGGRERGVSG